VTFILSCAWVDRWKEDSETYLLMITLDRDNLRMCRDNSENKDIERNANLSSSLAYCSK
jgi:hypothetical protein